MIDSTANFMKIPLVIAELFHADGRTEGHDETSSRFSQFLRKAHNTKKNHSMFYDTILNKHAT
jgi:hypothetical protein